MLSSIMTPSVGKGRAVVCLLLLVAGLASAYCFTAYGDDSTFERIEQSVVRIWYGRPHPTSQGGWGSGFVIDTTQGFVATNNHVIAGYFDAACRENGLEMTVETCNGRIYLTPDRVLEKVRTAVPLANRDEKGNITGLTGNTATDLAFIEIPELRDMKIPSLPIASSSSVEKGDKVAALGFPGAAGTFDQSLNPAFEVIITQGNISGTAPYTSGVPLFTTTAAINRGNSGGPLLNERGEVIGVNTLASNDEGSPGSPTLFAIQSDVIVQQLRLYKIPFVPASEYPRWLLPAIGAAVLLVLGVLVLMFVLLRTPKRLSPSVVAGRGQASGTPMLVGVAGEWQGKVIPFVNGSLRLGRDPRICNIVFSKDNTKISKNHAEISYDSTTRSFIVRDNNSRQGTYRRDGVRIEPGMRMALRSQESFYLSDRENEFRVEER